MSQDTEQFWSGQFGNEYLERNRVDWQARIPFWESAVDYCAPHSVLEIGANAGWNLRAIQAFRPSVECYGVDVNANAVNEARANGLEVVHTNALGILGLHEPDSIDLVYTCGVLIHIPPEDLESVMRAIIHISARYVLAVEYMAEETQEVEYRGHAGKLWKRNYAKLYQDLGLRPVAIGDTAQGFDQCGFVLLEKGSVDV